MPGAAKLQDSTSALYLTLQPETYRKCSSTGDGYTYDENGSLTENAKGERFTFDMEQHQTEFYGESNSSEDPDAIYYYDGEGRRVKKVAGSEVTLFVYDASGRLVAEYSTQLAGTQQVSYLTQDHLGSPRVITNENGTVTGRKDYSAFGEELITDSHRSVNDEYTGPELRKGYTGYEKDDESKLEFAQARYYNSVQGRFTTVDPLTASASIKNPQTFNRYSYVLNSPYKFTDPLGLAASSSEKCGFRCRVTNYINGTSDTLSDADRHLLSAHLELGSALGYSLLNAAYAEQKRQASRPDRSAINMFGSSSFSRPTRESKGSSGSNAGATQSPTKATVELGWFKTGIFSEWPEGDSVFRGEGVAFTFTVFADGKDMDFPSYSILKVPDDGDAYEVAAGTGPGPIKISTLITNGGWDTETSRWDILQPKSTAERKEGYIITIRTSGSIATFGVLLTAKQPSDDSLYGTIEIVRPTIRVTNSGRGRVVIDKIKN